MENFSGNEDTEILRTGSVKTDKPLTLTFLRKTIDPFCQFLLPFYWVIMFDGTSGLSLSPFSLQPKVRFSPNLKFNVR